MVVVIPIQGLHSIKQSKKIGLPNGFGEIRFGWSKFGDANRYAGYYQKRHGKNHTSICRMRPYWPRQNPGEAQQARLAKFAAGVAHWQSLSTGQKAVFEREAAPLHMSGFNRHQSLWLRDLIS